MGYVDGKTDATLLIEEDDIEQDYEYLVVLQVCVKADLFETEYDHTLFKNNDCYVVVNNHKQIIRSFPLFESGCNPKS